MNINAMLAAFDAKESVQWNAYGKLDEDDAPVHFVLVFTGRAEGEAHIDDRPVPEFVTEAWDLIETHGDDSHVEALMTGVLIGLGMTQGAPVPA